MKIKTNILVLGCLFALLGLAGYLMGQSSGSSGNLSLPFGLSFGSPTLTISSVANGNGAIALSGNTSGTATLTAPAVAGTTTNAVLSSNNLSAPALASTVATGTAPLTITSTTPVTNMVVTNHPQVQFCGTVVACSHTALTAAQVVFGTAALSSGTPSTAVITGISPAFTSTTSYKCFPNDVTTIANAVNVVTYSSGSSFTINGPTTVTDTVAYMCVGN